MEKDKTHTVTSLEGEEVSTSLSRSFFQKWDGSSN